MTSAIKKNSEDSEVKSAAQYEEEIRSNRSLVAINLSFARWIVFTSKQAQKAKKKT